MCLRPHQKQGKGISRMRVLVVDDDETSCQLLAKVFRSNGMEAEWTIDGLTAYDMALQRHYDLFVLDVRMPLVLGTELAEGLKNDNPHAKVILISSFADDALQKTAGRLGVSLLSKPFSLDRLLETAAEVLCPCA
jgi:DNA-binding response OmpR family regulator